MLKAFCAIGDKYYEPVMEYVLKHKVYLVHGLQRVATNLRENNQLVMMWYAERNYGETEEQQRAISLVSSFYQQLSLMSYAYEFTVAVWSVCCKQGKTERACTAGCCPATGRRSCASRTRGTTARWRWPSHHPLFTAARKAMPWGRRTQ